jgi:hypothetical protein
MRPRGRHERGELHGIPCEVDGGIDPVGRKASNLSGEVAGVVNRFLDSETG